MVDLSIIIVSWNVESLLKKCLASIYQYTRGITFELFVIDNASTDSTCHAISENFPQVKLIRNSKNLGFSAANNQGLRQAQADYLLLLNPDTELKEDSLSQMLQFMKNHQNCGISGCRLNNTDGTIQNSVRRFPGFIDQICILLKIHHLLPRLPPLRRYFANDFDYRQEQTVDQVMGAFFLINRKLSDQIGLLDENFFVWFEEVDFCRRAKTAGWLVMYTPITAITHHHAQSFKQVMSVAKQKMWNKSLRFYFHKHAPLTQYWLIACTAFIALGITYLVNLIKLSSDATNKSKTI